MLLSSNSIIHRKYCIQVNKIIFHLTAAFQLKIRFGNGFIDCFRIPGNSVNSVLICTPETCR